MHYEWGFFFCDEKFNRGFFLLAPVQPGNRHRLKWASVLDCRFGTFLGKTKKLSVHLVGEIWFKTYFTIWQGICSKHTDPISFVLLSQTCFQLDIMISHCAHSCELKWFPIWPRKYSSTTLHFTLITMKSTAYVWNCIKTPCITQLPHSPCKDVSRFALNISISLSLQVWQRVHVNISSLSTPPRLEVTSDWRGCGVHPHWLSFKGCCDTRTDGRRGHHDALAVHKVVMERRHVAVKPDLWRARTHTIAHPLRAAHQLVLSP